MLLDAGAIPKFEFNRYGDSVSPLILAARHGHAKIITLLLSRAKKAITAEEKAIALNTAVTNGSAALRSPSRWRRGRSLDARPRLEGGR